MFTYSMLKIISWNANFDSNFDVLLISKMTSSSANSNEEIEAHILRKFEIIQKLGKGAYGIVWKAFCKKTK